MLKKISVEKLPENIQAAWHKSMNLRGDATFFEVFGNNIDLYNWYIEKFYGDLFNSNRIQKQYKELLRIKLSSLHGCKFCNQGNRIDALNAGLSEQQVKSFDKYAEGPFSDSEKAVLELAEEISLTKNQGKLTSQLYKKLSRHFDDGQILELGMIAGLLTGIAKFIFAFDLVEKEEYCRF